MDAHLDAEQWHRGTIHWFDIHAGEGMVKDSYGRCHFVCDTAADSNFELSTIKPFDLIEFRVVTDTNFTQIEKIRRVRES